MFINFTFDGILYTEGVNLMQIKESKNNYISNNGICFKHDPKTNKWVKRKTSILKGYEIISFQKNKKKYNTSAHRLVAIYFIPNPDLKEIVNHKNFNKLDNNIDNLEWVTTKENNNHFLDSLKKEKHPFLSYNNRVSKNKKIFEGFKLSKAVLCFDLNGKYVCTFRSIMEAQRKTGINNSQISATCKGKWQSAGGYLWEYEKRFKE
jgi:hypothetical protein